MAKSILDFSIEEIARIFGGDVHGNGSNRHALIPGPGHSASDRSLSVKTGSSHPRGLLTHSFAGDSANDCRDHIFSGLGLPAFSKSKQQTPSKSNGGRKPARPHVKSEAPAQPTPDWAVGLESDGRLEAAMSGGSSTDTPENVAGLKFVESYPYPDASGKVTYRNCRYLENNGAGPKTFRQWRLVGDRWIKGLAGITQIPYCLDEVVKHPHAPILSCEGEKDANTGRRLGYVATSCAEGQWSDSVQYFKDRDVIVLPDFNQTGVRRALETGNALYGTAKSIRMVMLPGLDGNDNNKDLTDFISKNPKNEKRLADILRQAPIWTPGATVEGFAAAELVVKKKESEAPPGTPLKLTYFDECGAFINKREIFKGLLALGETSGWIGPSGSGKSAILTEISVHCAQAREWRGFKYKAKQPLGVLILALERADLYKRRFHAYSLRDNIRGLPIAIAGAILDLMNPTCIEIIVASVRAAERKLGVQFGIIVIDTYSKGIAVSGGDEDKARDQNKAAAHLREIHSRIDVHIALVGHTGKDESRGSRGSNAHPGDADMMNQFNIDNEVETIETTKANDAPLGIFAGFKIELFDLGLDADGDQRQTSILDPNQYLTSNKQKKREPPPKAKAALHSLFETIADGRIVPKPNDPHVPKSVTSGTSLSHWKCDALSRGILNREGNHREEFRRIHVTLQNLGLIGIWEDFVWPVT
jgi:AAA domain